MLFWWCPSELLEQGVNEWEHVMFFFFNREFQTESPRAVHARHGKRETSVVFLNSKRFRTKKVKIWFCTTEVPTFSGMIIRLSVFSCMRVGRQL